MRNKLTSLLLAAFIALGAFATPMLIDGGVDTVLAGHQGSNGNTGG